MKLLMVTFLAVISIATASAATKREFQTGKLLDISRTDRLVDGTTYQWVVFRVELGGLTYTARGDRVGRNATSGWALLLSKSGDTAQDLIVGDAIEISISGDSLVLRKPSGKELKARIMKRERAPAK